MNKSLIREWIKTNEPQGSAKLAVAAGISASTIYNILFKDHAPSLSNAQRLAKVLNVSLDELTSSTEDEEKQLTSSAR